MHYHGVVFITCKDEHYLANVDYWKDFELDLKQQDVLDLVKLISEAIEFLYMPP